MLLIDAATTFSDGRIRLLDVANRQLTETTGGPDVRLDHFAMTHDGQAVYMLHAGLFQLSVGSGVIAELELSFNPRNLNLTPDEATLLLREDDDTIRLYDLSGPAPSPEVELPRIELEIEVGDLPGGGVSGGS